MRLFKLFANLAIFLMFFSEEASSIQDDNSKELQIVLKTSENNLDQGENTPLKSEEENEKRSSEFGWGLSHWFNGVVEYTFAIVSFGRKLGVPGGRYKKHYVYTNKHEEVTESDCSFGYEFLHHTYFECGSIALLFCCPFATISHLCCLPCAIFENSPKEQENIYSYEPPHVIYPSFDSNSSETTNDSDERRKRQEEDERYRGMAYLKQKEDSERFQQQERNRIQQMENDLKRRQAIEYQNYLNQQRNQHN